MLVAKKRTVSSFLINYLWDVLVCNEGEVRGYDAFLEMLVSGSNMSSAAMAGVLRTAVHENLITVYQNKTKFLKNTGDRERMTFRLPNPTVLKRADHDWYCFHCNKAGEILQCQSCPRVYHLGCLAHERKPRKNTFTCPCCILMSFTPSMNKGSIRARTLNEAIWVLIRRYEDNFFASDVYKNGNGETYAVASNRPESDAWRFQHFIYFPMDLEKMKTKAIGVMYNSLDELQVDFETMFHSLGVFFEEEHVQNKPGILSEMLKEFKVIMLCPDCYINSVKPNQAFWMCLPCPATHGVVWATHNNLTYWPAKLLKMDGQSYYVRFFWDNSLQVIEAGHIQTIDVPGINQLVKDRPFNFDWKEACKQLRTYQETSESQKFRRMFNYKKKSQLAIMPGNDSNMKRVQSDTSGQPAPKRMKTEFEIAMKAIVTPVLASSSTSAVSVSQEVASSSAQVEMPSTSSASNADKPYPLHLQYDLANDSYAMHTNPDRNTEGSMDMIRYVLKHGRAPLCCYCWSLSERYCCRSLVFCSTGCQEMHLKKERGAHSCVQKDA